MSKFLLVNLFIIVFIFTTTNCIYATDWENVSSSDGQIENFLVDKDSIKKQDQKVSYWSKTYMSESNNITYKNVEYTLNYLMNDCQNNKMYLIEAIGYDQKGVVVGSQKLNPPIEQDIIPDSVSSEVHEFVCSQKQGSIVQQGKDDKTLESFKAHVTFDNGSLCKGCKVFIDNRGAIIKVLQGKVLIWENGINNINIASIDKNPYKKAVGQGVLDIFKAFGGAMLQSAANTPRRSTTTSCNVIGNFLNCSSY